MAKTAPAVNNGFYDDLGEKWFTAQDDPVALLRAEGKIKQIWILEMLRRHARDTARQGRFLDIGCGGGFLAEALAAQGHTVFGMDLSLATLQWAQRKNTSPAGWIRGDALVLPFPDASLDAVAAMDFLEHVEYPDRAITEASRVLKPGGLFFFHTFNRNFLSWLIVIKGLEWFVRNTPKHMHVLRLFITPLEMDGYCRAAGLEPLAWSGLGPRWRRRAFWRLLATGVVPEDFEFQLTSSKLLGYLGLARKR